MNQFVGANGQPAGLQGVQSIIKSLSITGNVYIDSFIFMNAYAFFKSYFDTIIKFMKNFITKLFEFTKHYITSFIKSKVTGKVVLRSSMDQKHQLYLPLKMMIFDSYLKGDVADDWKFKWLQIEKDVKSDYFERWKKWQSWNEKDIEISVNYLAKKKEDILQFDSYSTRVNETIVKIFKYKLKSQNVLDKFTDVASQNFLSKDREIYLRYTLNINNHKIDIDMIIFDLPKKTPPKTTYFRILTEFMDKRFKLSERLIYTSYFSCATSGTYQAFINNGLARSLNPNAIINGELMYSDKHEFLNELLSNMDELPEDNNYLSKNNTLTLFNQPPTIKSFDISKLFKVSPLNSTTTSIGSYLHELAGQNFNTYAYRNNRCGYFEYKYMIIYLRFDSFFIIKKKSPVTIEEVNDIFKHIFDKNIDYNLNLNNKTTVKRVMKNQVSLYKRTNNKWQQLTLGKRSFKTVHLPKDLKKDIIDEFDSFLQMQRLYSEYEIPYRKGFLFYGPPGTGKTTLIKAIAFEYQIPLYILDVNDSKINDESIITILNGLGNNGLKILLFEDIDTAFADKEKMLNETKNTLDRITLINDKGNIHKKHEYYKTKDTKSEKNCDENTKIDKGTNKKNDEQEILPQIQSTKFLTYSGLLNALDGVMSNQTGVITIMTTNYINKLGDAFMRPGRIDRKFELKECNQEQIELMTKSFIDTRIKLSKIVFKQCLSENNSFNKLSEEVLKAKISKFASLLCDSKTKQSHIKPCQLQAYLLKHIKNLQDIFNNFNDLLNNKY